MAERDFVRKLEKAGFVDISITERTPMTLDDLALSPLFDEELIALMRKLLSVEKQAEVATAVVVKAHLA